MISERWSRAPREKHYLLRNQGWKQKIYTFLDLVWTWGENRSVPPPHTHTHTHTGSLLSWGWSSPCGPVWDPRPPVGMLVCTWWSVFLPEETCSGFTLNFSFGLCKGCEESCGNINIWQISSPESFSSLSFFWELSPARSRPLHPAVLPPLGLRLPTPLLLLPK